MKDRNGLVHIKKKNKIYDKREILLSKIIPHNNSPLLTNNVKDPNHHQYFLPLFNGILCKCMNKVTMFEEVLTISCPFIHKVPVF